jgi:hypothetical protein
VSRGGAALILRAEQALYVRSMGKALKVVAITDSVQAANRLMGIHASWAIVAEFDWLILLADKYDHGIPLP